MNFGLSESQLKEIQNCIAKHSTIDKAILFGSRALNTFKPYSDVDIAIQGKNVDLFLAAKLKLEIEEETYLPFFFDFLAYDSISNSELKEHIDSKGIEIYRKISQ